jgi:hypothetical protein
LGEFSPAVGLQLQRHSTCIHAISLVVMANGVFQITVFSS